MQINWDGEAVDFGDTTNYTCTSDYLFFENDRYILYLTIKLNPLQTIFIMVKKQFAIFGNSVKALMRLLLHDIFCYRNQSSYEIECLTDGSYAEPDIWPRCLSSNIFS